MKLAIHGHNYKATALSGLDRHNRRLNKEYGNENIDRSRRDENIVVIAPVESLYRDAKKRIEEQVLSHGGRVTKASNWITEFTVYAPEGLSSERLREYFETVVTYFAKQIGKDNILSAVVHNDETHSHLHLDFTPIVENRLSSKKVMTRSFLLKLHNELPKILSNRGFDIQRGEPVEEEEKKLKGRSTKQYKQEIEAEKNRLLTDCKKAKLITLELIKGNLKLAHKLIEKQQKHELSR